jgi:hypoxanthine phosphoribosyltransferase
MVTELSEVVVDVHQIQKMVQDLAEKITFDYRDKELILIGVLKGGFVFLADLMRAISIPVGVDFISVASYGSSTDSSGIVRIVKDLDMDIKGKHVLLVEDIVDTGLTLKHLRELFETRDPASVKMVAAFDKPSRRKVDLVVDYIGIKVPDKFLVGYGLDFDEKYRSLPYLSALDRE